MLSRLVAAAWRRAPLPIVLLGTAGLALPGGGAGQEPVAGRAVLAVEENVRAEPEGTVIGRLSAGAPVRVEERAGDWTRVTFEGLVWIQSLQVREFGSYDLIVSAVDGENLRAEPAGAVLGRLGRGTLLEEVERMAGWARVRRTAWIWSGSLGFAEDAALAAGEATPGRADPSGEAPGLRADLDARSLLDPPGGAPGLRTDADARTLLDPQAGARGAGPSARPSPPDGTDPTPGAPPASDAFEPSVAEWLRAASGGAAILAAPEGDTLARTAAGAELRVVERQGSWTRVQMEGWVFEPGLPPGAPGPDAGAILRDVRPVDLLRDPERFRGRIVELTLEYISLEHAEQIRSGFREGEPFMLTRSSGEGRIFVYVAVPAERVAEVGRLVPLDRIRVIARVRTPSSGHTGSPILDLHELRVLR